MTADRPRDRLGRPLPPGSRDAGPPVPDITGLGDREVWELGVSLLDQGLPFHAHEVYEERWRTCPPSERQAWRALAQWAAAATHLARGNRVGAERLAARARASWTTSPAWPAAIDGDLLLRSCEDIIDTLR